MNQPQISVIVPVYNVEKYLSRCIESILSQTFTDFELLLIDDGSTDRSGEICDEYAKKDTRIRVFHTKNRGVSAARNLGLDNAKGEWISFVDSDDWVEDDYLRTLFHEAKLNKDSIVWQSFFIEIEHDARPVEIYKSCEYFDTVLRKPFEENQIIENILNVSNVNVFAKLFNQKTIIDNNISFLEKTSISEDVVFLHEYLLFVEEIYLQASVSYHYIIRDNSSLSRIHHSFKEWFALSCELIRINDMLINKFSIKSIENKKYLYNKYGLFQLYRACVSTNSENCNIIFEYARSKAPLFKAYYTPSTIQQKIFKLLFFCDWMPYKLIFFIFNFYKVLFSIIKLPRIVK